MPEDYSPGCSDLATGGGATPNVRNTIKNCQPGAKPRFIVQFTNPYGLKIAL
jgi:hypothetical protein